MYKLNNIPHMLQHLIPSAVLKMKIKRRVQKLFQNCLAQSSQEQTFFPDKYWWPFDRYDAGHADRLLGI
jgi:uncharacterized protein (DUF927 family)